MRTTFDLADDLMAAVTARASDEGRTVTALVEEALHAHLAAAEHGAGPVDPLPSWGDPGSRVLVDLTDRGAVRDALDDAG